MNLIRRFGLAGLLGAAGAFAIWACADNDYGTSWDAQGSSGILSPGNDTRSNFVLLMADRDATKVADARQMASGIVPFDLWDNRAPALDSSLERRVVRQTKIEAKPNNRGRTEGS